ncbi:MAG: hypothetical protein K0R83_2190 [Caulobacter sp.]|jgi:hypothetical protein|nr:hypothetical protein [Caulobacter sp.]
MIHIATSARTVVLAAATIVALAISGPALSQTVQLVQVPGPSGQVIEAAVWTPEAPSTTPRPLW